MSNNLIVKLNEKKNALWELKANHLSEEKEIYFKRALVSIMHTEGLNGLISTEKGASSILYCISQALQMGLQLGGHIPQAHIVPYKDKAELVPTAEGYKFIALCEPKIIKDFHVRSVHENEKFEIDYAENTVQHSYDGKKPKGQLVGVWARIVDLRGNKIIEYMARHEIEEIRNNHSKSYQAYVAKKIPKQLCAWETDFNQQAMKTAVKRFLKPFVSLKEGLQMSMDLESEIEIDDSIPVPVEPGPEQQPEPEIDKRMGSRLDNIIDAEVAEVENEPEPEPEQGPEEKKEEPKKDKKNKGDVF